MKLNSTIQFQTGELLISEGNSTDYAFFILKGKAEVFGRGCRAMIGAGTLIGLNVFGEDSLPYSCRAREDITAFVTSSKPEACIAALAAVNKDYPAAAIASCSRVIGEVVRTYRRLGGYSQSLYTGIKEGYNSYIAMMKKNKCSAELIPEVVQLDMYQAQEIPDEEKICEYLEYPRISYETLKAFFGSSLPLAVHTIKEMNALAGELIDGCGDLSDYVYGNLMLFLANPDYSLFRCILCLGFTMSERGIDTDEISGLADNILKILPDIKDLISLHTGREWTVDEEQLMFMRESFASGFDFREEDASQQNVISGDVADMLGSLKGSLEQITGFAGYDSGEAFMELLDRFNAMPDKESTEDEFRVLRKSITEHFFALYELTVMKAAETGKMPLAVRLFLNYGYVSEKLVSEKQLAQLIGIKHQTGSGPCTVYTMYEWLNAIYRGEQEPSKNDMGQDFTDVLREMRKQGKIDENEERELLTNGEVKLHHEITNVMKNVERVVHGRLLSYVPILYSEAIIGDVLKGYNSASRINDTLKEIVKLDFSMFYRESLYTGEQKEYEREYIQKEIFPVFVLYPQVGQNVIMWQEITGRRRDTPGRFFTPILSYGSLTDMLIKACGQFRWSLCKTIQGTNWNNIQVHSLTADYSDYIQFFKKNRELSEERREKLKLQIQRGRNNLREIFVIDYEAWMKSEASGAVKLNKVAREILATYCPFDACTRAVRVKQPIYEEAFARNMRERSRKAKDLELRIRSYEAKGVETPPEVTSTLTFYREM